MKNSLLMKAVPVILILFFIIDGVHLYIKGIQQGRLSLTAVDVGQGNSILIRLPGGKKMLVDGGGFFDDSFDLGKFVLAPYLWHERITRIDTVVLTHPHPDHLQGLLFILENFHVREVWTNGETSGYGALPFLPSDHPGKRDCAADPVGQDPGDGCFRGRDPFSESGGNAIQKRNAECPCHPDR